MACRGRKSGALEVWKHEPEQSGWLSANIDSLFISLSLTVDEAASGPIHQAEQKRWSSRGKEELHQHLRRARNLPAIHPSVPCLGGQPPAADI